MKNHNTIEDLGRDLSKNQQIKITSLIYDNLTEAIKDSFEDESMISEISNIIGGHNTIMLINKFQDDVIEIMEDDEGNNIFEEYEETT